MSKIVFFNSYKLKKGVSIPDFLIAVEKLNKDYISKQEGYVSFQLLRDGDRWADSTVFENMEAAKNFAKCTEPNELAEEFYSFLNLSTCRSNLFSTEQSY